MVLLKCVKKSYIHGVFTVKNILLVNNSIFRGLKCSNLFNINSLNGFSDWVFLNILEGF